jgi:hypothetical protein
MRCAAWRWLVAVLALLVVPGCDPRTTMREATVEEVRSYFEDKRMKVVTFLGYSGAGYEDEAAMLQHASRILDENDPKTTIVNIGATETGVGAVYELAKRRGFLTTGIVSSQAKEGEFELSPYVDVVFYVKDATWGGFAPGTETLSPTSRAMVENTDVLVAIGGGEVARDEITAAKRLGKTVKFIPADMNHEIAREKARKKGRPEPTDFRGAAEAAA